MSKEDLGVLSEYGPVAGSEASEKLLDFRRAGGKKPSVLRGMRSISTGSALVGIRTHASCLSEAVSWDEVSESESDKGSDELRTSNGVGGGSRAAFVVTTEDL